MIQKGNIAEEFVHFCKSRGELDSPIRFSFVNISSFVRNKKHHLTEEPRTTPTLGGAPSKELRSRGAPSLRGSTHQCEVNLRSAYYKVFLCVGS